MMTILRIPSPSNTYIRRKYHPFGRKGRFASHCPAKQSLVEIYHTSNSLGNWLAYDQKDTLQTRTHNAANEIVTIDGSTTSITTDSNGNMTRILGFDLTFDAWNRLVRVAKPDGTLVAEYRYDALNRRITKTTPAETRYFYYNRNWQCLTEYANSSATPDTTYLWGLRYIDDIICRTQNSQTLYSLSDPNWNVVALVDTNGLPVERYTYTAFGKLHIYDPAFNERAESQCVWTRTFTGQVLDSETGLMSYRNRFYSPILGRFIMRDPIGYNAEDENLYRYVQNNPFIFVDPEGEYLQYVIIGPLCWGCYQALFETFFMAMNVCENEKSVTLFSICMIKSMDEAMSLWDTYTTTVLGAACLCCGGLKSAVKNIVPKIATAWTKKKIGLCMAYYSLYKSNCPKCTGRTTMGEAKKSVACLSAEVMGRHMFLHNKCDYFLEGSKKRGSKKAEDGHLKELHEKFNALKNVQFVQE